MTLQTLLNKQGTIALHIKHAEKTLAAAEQNLEQLRDEFERASAQIELVKELQQTGFEIKKTEQQDPEQETTTEEKS